MSAFDDFRATVLNEAADFARDTLASSASQARADAEDFVNQSAEKLERWTRLLKDGELTRDEFAALVRSQRDLAQLSALTRGGIGIAKAQQFRDKLTDVMIKTAFSVLL